MAQRTKSVTLTSKRGNTHYRAINSVRFFISPEMSESRHVNYVDISDVRLPSSILIWMGSPSRTFSLNAKLLARSTAEADRSFKDLNMLKSWCVTNTPTIVGNTINRVSENDFLKKPPASPSDTEGEEEPIQFQLPETLFADTPPVLLLEGYGGQFRNIPVVITDLTITYPSDIDYVQNAKGVYVPILQDVSISLKEARDISGHSGAISTFNLSKFKAGTLEYW